MRTDVSFRRESWRTFYRGAAQLLGRHWSEVAFWKDIPLDVDYDGYARAERAGLLRIYTMRLTSGVMIGYALYVVSFNLHYKASLQAKQDVLYLAPEHRQGWLGVKLVRYADAALAEEGVQVVVQHVKIDHPALATIAKRNGYEPIEVIWGKRLDIPRDTGTRQGECGGEDATKARAAATANEQRETIEWDQARR